LIEAELNAGSEALIQPFVYRYTQKLGSPYSLTDALTRVVAAGVPAARSAAGSSRDQGVQRLAGLDDLLETFERHSSKAKPGPGRRTPKSSRESAAGRPPAGRLHDSTGTQWPKVL